MRRTVDRLIRALVLTSVLAAAHAEVAAAQASVRYRVVRGLTTHDTLNAGVVNRNAVIVSGAESEIFARGGAYQIRWESDAFGIRNGQLLRLGPPATVQAALNEALGSRRVAETTVTDESVRALANFPAGTERRPLIAAAVPFEVFGPGGRRAELVMFQRHTSGSLVDSVVRNSRVFGARGDTVRVQVPPNAWLPGDTLYVIENVEAQRTVTMRLILACASNAEPSRNTCNPLALNTPGATGYLPMADGYVAVWRIPSDADR